MNRLFSSVTPAAPRVLPLLLFFFATAIALPKFSSTAPLRPEASAGTPGTHLTARDVSNVPAGSAGMQVQIDPETGALVPFVSSGGNRMGPSNSHSIEGLQVVTRADGRRSVNLQGRFMESYVATIDSAGGTHLGCLPEGLAGQLVHDHAIPTPVGPVER